MAGLIIVGTIFAFSSSLAEGGNVIRRESADRAIGLETDVYDPVNKAGLRRTFVKGIGPKAPHFLTTQLINTIRGVLVINYSLPAMNLNSKMPEPFNETCGFKSLSCKATKFTVRPGMAVDISEVRGFALTDPSTALTRVTPTYSWAARADKLYSFLMVDALSKAPLWTKLPGNPNQFFHYGVFNIRGLVMHTGNATSEYVPPGNPVTNMGNHYTFSVFEHDQAVNLTIALNPPQQFVLTEYLQKLGLTELVAFNYFRAFGTPLAHMTFLMVMPTLVDVVAPCSQYGNKLNWTTMCATSRVRR